MKFQVMDKQMTILLPKYHWKLCEILQTTDIIITSTQLELYVFNVTSMLHTPFSITVSQSLPVQPAFMLQQ